MLQAPITEGKTRPESARTTLLEPEPEREEHPRLAAKGGLLSDGASDPADSRNPSSVRQHFSGLQRSIGNRAVLRLLSRPSPAIQTKLTVNEPGDRHEQEADRVAEQVMRMPEPQTNSTGDISDQHPRLQRKCAECEEEETKTTLRRQTDLSVHPISPLPDARLTRPESGSALDVRTRQFFEPRFQRDFSTVRLHTGVDANTAARSVNARAYTLGPSIVFRQGEYRPDSQSGMFLLAHELSHVIQQGYAPAIGNRSLGSKNRSAPTVQRLVFDPAAPARVNDLSNIELAEAIEQTEDFLQAMVASSDAELRARENLKVLRAEREARRIPSPLEEGKQEAWQEGQAASGLGIVQVDIGTWFYTNKQGVPRRRLLLNETVAVERKLPGNWYLIVTRDGDAGYVDAATINTSLPDPEAQLYRIRPGDTAIGIVKTFYKDFKYSEDQRFYVNVLVLVNHQAKRPGIKNPTLDASGEGRADVDWEASKVEAGRQIWIPGQSFAKSLKDKVPTGSISYDAFRKVADFLSEVGEFLLGTVAFIAGLLHGALESLWDLLVGLVDLVKMVFSLIKEIVLGEIIGDIKNFWDTLKNLKLSDILDAVADWLDKKWNASGTWTRWHNRGWLIGYLIMEVLMLVASDGIITAVKWVGKAAKIEKLIAKIPFMVKVVEKAKEIKQAGKLSKILEGTKIGESLLQARKWARDVLAVPLEILELLTEETIGRLKKLPSWAVERFRELSAAAMKVILGCASPCKVDIAKIMEHLAGLAEKGYVGAKKLADKSDVLKALSKFGKQLNTAEIAEYLESHPALMKVIKKAELTDADFLALGEFLTGADASNAATARKTFTRYLTYLVPGKTGNDISKFNAIMQDMFEVDKAISGTEKAANQLGQARAFKGPMFEAFVRMHVPEFAGKAFKRVRFKSVKGVLEFATEARSSDFFIEATGELWDFKHSLTVDWDQAKDYIKILNQAQTGLPKVNSINYLFATEEMARANSKLKDLGAIVHYISSTGKMLVL
jgi:Domain of unknown function (DUF4157)